MPESAEPPDAAPREASAGPERRQDLFLAGLGHALRSPVATLEMGLQRLREGTGERDELEGGLLHDVQQLKTLVEDLVDVSRIARGTLVLRRAAVDLGAAVRAVVDRVRSSADERQQTLVLDLPERLVVEGDRTRLEQVVRALLRNAVLHGPRRGTIRVALAADAREVVLTVDDEGPGIRPEDLEAAFEPFRRVDPERGGAGFGLPLARGLVELHGGSLDAGSPDVGRGSRFRVRLPRRTSPDERTEPARLPGSLRVAVVDDVRDYREGLALLLRSRGCQATSFASGEKLLGAWRELRPHAVLLDLGLPGLTGYDVAARLRDEGLAEDAWLIAVTGFGDPATEEKTRALGFDRRLVKPVDFAVLEEVLLECAERGL